MPLVGDSFVYRTETPSYTLYINIVEDRGTGLPIKIFINAGKSGSDEMAWADALARLFTALLENGMPMTSILMFIDGITTSYKSSGPMKIAEVLNRYWNEKISGVEV